MTLIQSALYVLACIGALCIICTMAFLWLARDAPLMDEPRFAHEGDPIPSQETYYTPEMHREWDAYVDMLRKRGAF